MVVKIEYNIGARNKIYFNVAVGEVECSQDVAKDILDKIKNSGGLYLHNSTTSHEEIYYGRGRRMSLFDAVLSQDEKASIMEAEKDIQKKIKKLAKAHKEEFGHLLGKMKDKYEVEFTTLDGMYSGRRIPLSINLNDKSVDVSINDWGAGTQNRTYILMSIFQASRIKKRDSPEDKITPIVVIEEPESFLHPSAQAEFGKTLKDLAKEMGIQLIITTHSPYMLNTETPASNILLRRKYLDKSIRGTEVVQIQNDNWMLPFSEQLGVESTEMAQIKGLVFLDRSCVLLVEGPSDRQYLEHIRKNKLTKEHLSDDVVVVEYGGKNALTNTLLLKFSLQRFERFFITFDYDAKAEVEKSLNGLGYKDLLNYSAVGNATPGKQAIEGLLPDRVIKTVIAANTDLVMAATSNTGDAKSSKSKLKELYCKEFCKHLDYSEPEMVSFNELIKIINKGLLSSGIR